MCSLHRFALWLIVLVCASPLYAQSDSAIPEAHFTFTTIDVPGAGTTGVLGINSAGDVVGDYGAASNAPAHGFLLKDGIFIYFDYPDGDDTIPVGINDFGVISGSSFVNNSSAIVSFLYDGISFTTIRAKGKSVTLANGINDAGNVVGGYGSLGVQKGFVLVGTHFKTISPPGAYVGVFGNDINNLKQIVGNADDTGFLYSHGQYKTIAIPGASAAVPWGINDDGIIVGSYEKGPPYAFHGFVLRHGKYLSVDYPGAAQTLAFGVNNAGQIVGVYSFDQQVYHGFVTSPVAPEDLAVPSRREKAADTTGQ